MQYRIAEYVCQVIAGRNALNFASCTSHTAHLVAVALEHHLLYCLSSGIEEHTRAWLQHYPDVRVLELWEHPNNFELLKSPSLIELVIEDEPLQITAVANSRVTVERVEFYARYGTPPSVIIDAFNKISFTDLDFEDVNGLFFEHVDIAAFAEACKSITILGITAPPSAQEPVKRLIENLPNLETLAVDMRDVCIDFKHRLPGRDENPNVTNLGLYINHIPWFETFALPKQLRSLWLASDRGWGENEVLQFASIVMDFPNLSGLSVKFRGRSERFFPPVSSLTKFWAYWDDFTVLPDGDEIDYKPDKGIVAQMIKGLPHLCNLRLRGVALDDEEVAQIIEIVGDYIENIDFPIGRQEANPMERLLVIMQALTRYTKCLEVFTLCNRDNSGQEAPITWKPIKTKRKREILQYLDRLARHVPNVHLVVIEVAILDNPEEKDDDEQAEEKLQKYFTLRRCRGGMNESGHIDHMCNLARLLETGCEDLQQDRKAAVDLYKRAAERGDSGDAILNLWRLTEDPKDSSLEPKPGGAFELILELEKKGVQKLPDIADAFLSGTDDTEAIPSAAVRLLQLMINRGFTDTHCETLAELVESGYEDVPPDPERAFALYKLAVDDHDDPDAMFSIAEMLRYGFGDRGPDPVAAREYLERGTRLEWPPCMNDLALLISQGYNDVPPDPGAAISLFKKAVAYGNTVSMSNLARLYIDTGDGDFHITQKAIELYERAISESQSSHVMFLLARLYEAGCGDMMPNFARAKQLYIQAIEHGESAAFVPLGNIVCDGRDGKPPDPTEAIRLFQLAIDTGDRNARGMAFAAYGELMERGCADVEANGVKAVELYRQGIENGNSHAIILLAISLIEGRPYLDRDCVEACELLEQGIELGSTASMTSLANLLKHGGEGVEQDVSRAKDLLNDALNAGCSSPIPSLGHMLEFGIGVDEPDPEEAEVLYLKGVEAGVVEAIVQLGVLYERGFGQLWPDPERAIFYYNFAINHGCLCAKNYLGFLTEDGYLDKPPDCKAAMEMYESAAELGSKFAEVYKGMLIESGYDDCEPDPERARSIYEEAVTSLTSGGLEYPYAYAIGRLGRVIERNSGDDPVKLREAADWYRKGIAAHKEPTALYYLAGLLLKGYDGVDADIGQAVSMLEEATECGTFAPPFFLLAACLEKGYGDTEPDPKQAVILEEQGCFIMMNPSVELASIWRPWHRLRSPALHQA